MNEKKGAVPPQSKSLKTFIPPLPQNHGQWNGAAGNSAWLFDLTCQRRDIYNGGYDTWGNLIRQSECPNTRYVDFIQNYPDFSPCLIRVTNNSLFVDADYVFPAGLALTLNRSWNFRQADEWVAQGVNSTPGDIAYLRRDRKFTWHELETCDRMLLLPRVIHGYVPHGGGIEVLRVGPIGSGRAALPPMEERVIGGRRALCGKGICQIVHALKVRGTLREVPVIFYCDDDSGTPTQPQQERLSFLEQNWPAAEENAWGVLQEYADEEWGEEYGSGCGETAALSAVQIFPVDTTMREIDIGLIYENFVGDPEHGLGVRILGDQEDMMIAGPGDVAL